MVASFGSPCIELLVSHTASAPSRKCDLVRQMTQLSQSASESYTSCISTGPPFVSWVIIFSGRKFAQNPERTIKSPVATSGSFSTRGIRSVPCTVSTRLQLFLHCFLVEVELAFSVMFLIGRSYIHCKLKIYIRL